jgi:hypothetical protein
MCPVHFLFLVVMLPGLLFRYVPVDRKVREYSVIERGLLSLDMDRGEWILFIVHGRLGVYRGGYSSEIVLRLF